MPDTSKFRPLTEKSLKRATAGLQVKIPVVLDKLAEVRAKLEQLTEDRIVRIRTIVTGDNVDENQSGTLRLDSDIDTREIQAELLRHRFKINIDPDVDLAGLRARLAAFRGSVDVDVNIDEDRLRRAAGNLSELGSSAGQVGNQFGGMSSRVMLLGAAIAALIPLVVGLAATLIAAIPSLVMMGGLLGGAIALGIDGIKNSFEKFTKSLEPLRERISAIFERGFDKAFTTISTGIQKLEPLFGSMAAWIGGLFRTLANVTFIGKGFEFLSNTLKNTTAFLDQLQPVIQTGMTAFLQLASIGSESFGRLADTIATFTQGFSDFVDRVASSGALDRAFEGLQIALAGLSDGFWDLMDAGLAVMAQIGPSVGRFFESFGNFAKAAMPILGSFLNVILDVASAFMDALAPALTRLQPAFEALATFIGEFADAIGTALGPVLESLAGVLGDILVAQIEAWLPVIPVLAEALGQFFQIIADFLNEHSDEFATLMSVMPTIFSELLQAVLPLLPKLFEMFIACSPLVPLFTELVEAIAPIIERSLPLFTQFITEALIPVMQFAFWIVDLATRLGRFLFSVDGARQGISDLGNTVGEVVANIRDWIAEAWSNVIQWTQETWDNFVTAIQERLSDAETAIDEFIDGCVRWFDDLPAAMVEIGRNIIQGLINGIRKGAEGLWSVLGDITSGIRSAITNPLGIFSPSRVMRGYGNWISVGLAKGIKDSADQPVKETKNMADRMRDAATDSFKDFPKTLGNAWASSLATDLGFSSSGAIGSLIGQLLDPQARYEDEKNIYVVKDLDDAERKSNNKKNKKALQYKPPGMRK